MRKREMALAFSSELVREEQQSSSRVSPPRWSDAGPVLLFSPGQVDFRRRLVFVCKALPPSAPFSKVQTSKPQFNTSFIKLWKSLVSRWETCKFLVAARFAYKAENACLKPG